MAVVILLLLGAAAFLLAALNVTFEHVLLVPLGLLFWVIAEIIDNAYERWPRRHP